MEIRKIADKDMKSVRYLWHEVFPEDSDDFLNWYFTKVYMPSNSWGAFEGTRLLSMATVARYKFCVRNKLHSANFLQGVGTAKSEQGRGESSAVISRVLNDLNMDGEAFSFLNTFIHPFYEKLGYTTYTFSRRETIPAKEGAAFDIYGYEDIDDITISRLSRIYKNAVERTHGWRLRNTADIKRILYDSTEIGDSVLITAKNGDHIGGYAIAEKSGDSLTAFETVVESDEMLDSFAAAAAQMGLNSFACTLPSDSGDPGRMMRIVNIESALENIVLGDGECVIKIHDGEIAKNDGTWHIFSRSGRTKVTKTIADAGVNLTIAELGQMVMGIAMPVTGSDETSENVRKMFTPQKCINYEQY